VAVTVSAKKEDGYVVAAVYVGGANVLRPGEDAWDIDGNKFYSRMGADRLNGMLTEELVVPTHLLKVTYTLADAGTDQELRFTEPVPDQRCAAIADANGN
jgi:hypothetical protein